MVLGFILSGDAWGVFGGMCVRDLVSWNSMVDGYVKVGDLGRAHRVFDEMGERNVVFDEMANLFANQGLVNEAVELLKNMRIDVNMSQQSSLWDGLLGSCRFKGDVVFGGL
ncbi:pentatricopeptide repeat protein [Artemisia annua]|uniref:Pentatricopeptide repeat protein n=1 Tax=Artemisia annua TaxID=35608 RepID=A0A2U1M5J0_ARTAN|nr:pentatricopeptide repeat protein [Artemisia annua]